MARYKLTKNTYKRQSAIDIQRVDDRLRLFNIFVLQSSLINSFNEVTHSCCITSNNVYKNVNIMQEKEIWKDIEGYKEYYQVSDHGNVKRLARFSSNNHFLKERILKPHNNYGYLRVGLHKNHNKKLFLVHRLVLIAFKKNPYNKTQCNHIDGIKSNNYIDNLEWSTCAENNQHAYDTGLNKGSRFGKFGKDNPNSKPLFQINKFNNEIIKEWDSVIDVERKLGYHSGCIASACRGEYKTASGFKWRYK